MAFHLPGRKRITRWAYFRVRERHKVHKLSCQPNCSQGPEIHIHRYQVSRKLLPVLNKPFHTPNAPHSSSCFLSTCLLPGQPCSLSKLLPTAGHSPIHPRHLGPALLLPPDLVWAALHSTEGPFLNEITESWACLMPPKLLTQLGRPFPLPALYWTFSCLSTEHRSTEGQSLCLSISLRTHTACSLVVLLSLPQYYLQEWLLTNSSWFQNLSCLSCNPCSPSLLNSLHMICSQ